MTNFVGDYRHPDAYRDESIEQQQVLYRKIPAMLYAVDEGGTLVDVSDQCLQVLGYTRVEVVGRSGMDFMTEASQARLQTLFRSELVSRGQITEVECEFVKSDGQIVPLLLSATAERNANG